MRLRLQTQHQLFVTLVLASTVVLLSSTWLVYSHKLADEVQEESVAAMRERLLQRVKERAESIGVMLANDLSRPVYSYDLTAIGDQLSVFRSLYGVHSIIITGPEGSILHDGRSDIAQFGQLHERAPLIRSLGATNTASLLLDDRFVLGAFPIMMGDKLIGAALFKLTLEPELQEVQSFQAELEYIKQSQLRNLLYASATLMIILLIAIGGVTALLSRRFTRPIRQLAEAADQIGCGDYKNEVQLNRQDELGDLARAFNGMNRRIRAHQADLKRIAYHDSLTELPNRLLLKEKIEEALHHPDSSDALTALMFIDLDDFKHINDSLGHEAGDHLLKQVARRIARCLREGEDQLISVTSGTRQDYGATVCRLGGDEFTILVNGLRCHSHAAAIAQRVIRSLQRCFHIYQQPVHVGASIGITMAPTDGQDVETLLKNADQAMYQAKGLGKNNYQFFDPNLSRKFRLVAQIREDLNKALLQDEFELYFQPQVALDSGTIVGAEALIRWHHQEHGFISPAVFIPVAEESGQIQKIGHWVLNKAARQIAAWKSQTDVPFHIGINLSAQQIYHEELVDDLITAVNVHGIAPGDLHLEITETMLIEDKDKAIGILNRLCELGFAIWLDDFGTGYSSLSHLQQFPLAGIKVDQSFVSNLEKVDHDQALVRSIINLGLTMGLEIIAEGVETKAQCEMIWAWGGSLVQGYYYHKPLPACEFESLLLAETNRRGASCVTVKCGGASIKG
ncbi:MAG: EAL domain-containing protein [Marinobacter sp.]|uniref:putative bifunctional diguanylate cyclase/phosphodiesterase n=1 Tax=Marinobacter sp. TaxID=50741 RepID=UPI00299D147C|nr:EAL domain-containing protein [Marinobacter sp.]MDX1755700.1 EAL domain-containing protein [Marinobacter sp.]